MDHLPPDKMWQHTDKLWPHFVPLWMDLRSVTPNLLLAGGYGLILKQRWLLSQAIFHADSRENYYATPKGSYWISGFKVQTIVSLDRWNETTPRVTKDLDIITELKLIASPESQRQIDAILESHGFQVVERNARWQFEKNVADGQSIVLDFHAPEPMGKRDDLKVDPRRVKPKPSLGKGIHGRTNPEAIGCELHPFSFEIDGVSITVPNPVTWAIMKMVAMRDYWQKAQDADKPTKEIEFQTKQAIKHAQDICRIVAMVTREEYDKTGEVLEAVRKMPAFIEACGINSRFFKVEDGWGCQATRMHWTPEDYQTIQKMLSFWFAEPPSITD